MINQVIITDKFGKFQANYSNDNLSISATHPDNMKDKKGVYIWSVDHKGKQLVYYVGQTTKQTFKIEIRNTWIRAYKKGDGNINNPKKFKSGIRENIFPCNIDYCGRATNMMSSSDYKNFWEKTYKPIWDQNKDQIKEKLCEMLNSINIYYIPLEVDHNIEPECLESSLGLHLFNSEETFISKFMNENDFGPLIKSDKKFSDKKYRAIELKNYDKFYGIPHRMTFPFNCKDSYKNEYFNEMLDLWRKIK